MRTVSLFLIAQLAATSVFAGGIPEEAFHDGIKDVQIEEAPPVVVVTEVTATRVEPAFPTKGLAIPYLEEEKKKFKHGGYDGNEVEHHWGEDSSDSDEGELHWKKGGNSNEEEEEEHGWRKNEHDDEDEGEHEWDEEDEDDSERRGSKGSKKGSKKGGRKGGYHADSVDAASAKEVSDAVDADNAFDVEEASDEEAAHIQAAAVTSSATGTNKPEKTSVSTKSEPAGTRSTATSVARSSKSNAADTLMPSLGKSLTVALAGMAAWVFV